MIILFWDWKEQPSWSEINVALQTARFKTIFEVETDEDMYAIVIGAPDQSAAQAEWEREVDTTINGEEIKS